MPIVKQNGNGHGSLKDVQLLINQHQSLINSNIQSHFKELKSEQIIWKSPLSNDDYAEYSDNDFIKKIGLDINEIDLKSFWPRRGPQWDALAVTSSGKVIIVEAKANIPEIISPATDAKGKSKEKIDNALKETQIYLGIKNNIDWAGKFYQYTNRIAHLYFLRIVKKKKVFLINIYFTGDKSVKGPTTQKEWEAAIQVVNLYLGTSNHKLKKYMADIFIDVKDLK